MSQLEALLGGRDHPRHREQPGGLHHLAARRALHHLLHRAGAHAADPDHPRERGGPRGGGAGGAAGGGLPAALPPRRGHRPLGLPPPRAQRGRRAVLHAAGDVPGHRARSPRCGRSTRRSSLREGAVTQAEVDAMATSYRARLEEAYQASARTAVQPGAQSMGGFWAGLPGRRHHRARAGDGGRRGRRCAAAAEALTQVPQGFRVHPKLARVLEARAEMGRGERPLDWGTAEALAFASLALEGRRVRLRGPGQPARDLQPPARGAPRPPDRQHVRAAGAPRRGPGARSRSATASSPRRPRSATSTATAWRCPRRSPSGRRSSATS